MTEFLTLFSTIMFTIWLVCGIIGMFWPRRTQVTPRSYRDDRRPLVVIHNHGGRIETAYEPDVADLQQPNFDRWQRNNFN